MKPMYLPGVENAPKSGPYADLAKQMQAQSTTVPQIFHLFAFKPAVTGHLSEFTEGVMRGASPLSPGLRELIAAFTSRRNDCPF
jgi:hypothetical protein